MKFKSKDELMTWLIAVIGFEIGLLIGGGSTEPILAADTILLELRKRTPKDLE